MFSCLFRAFLLRELIRLRIVPLVGHSQCPLGPGPSAIPTRLSRHRRRLQRQPGRVRPCHHQSWPRCTTGSPGSPIQGSSRCRQRRGHRRLQHRCRFRLPMTERELFACVISNYFNKPCLIGVGSCACSSKGLVVASSSLAHPTELLGMLFYIPPILIQLFFKQETVSRDRLPSG